MRHLIIVDCQACGLHGRHCHANTDANGIANHQIVDLLAHHINQQQQACL